MVSSGGASAYTPVHSGRTVGSKMVQISRRGGGWSVGCHRWKSFSLTALIVAIVSADLAIAQDNCTDIIRHSRTITHAFSEEQAFTEHVDHFCREYERSRQQGGTANYGGSYEVLKLSMGRSRTEAENVASKYCRFDGDKRLRAAGYQEYMEGIAPGAFSAYQACVNARKEGVVVESVHPTAGIFELVVFHDDAPPAGPARLSVSTSAPVKCRWERHSSTEEPRIASVPLQERVRLRCTREDSAAGRVREPDFVHLIQDGGGRVNVNFPWSKWNDEGPVPTIEDIRRKLEERAEEMAVQVQMAREALTEARTEIEDLRGFVNEYMNRTWKDVTAERYPYPANHTPTEPIEGKNNSAYPIDIALIYEGRGDHGGPGSPTAFCDLKVFVGGVEVEHEADWWSPQKLRCSLRATVPPGETYRLVVQPTGAPGHQENKRSRILSWLELSVE